MKMEDSVKLKVLVIAALLSLFTTSAFAQLFPGRVLTTVLPGQVAAQVFNPYYEPIACSGQVFGQTAAGVVFNAYFIQQILPAGANRFAYVQASPFNPFVGGWANIYCQFI
jgi:hypothetical protein